MKYYFLALGTIVFVCVGCQVDGQQIFDKGEYHAPPAAMQMRPGPMVDGPGPGVIPPLAPPPPRMMVPQTTQVRFLRPEGMQIGWQIPGSFAENQLVAPGRYNFLQGATYRLKLTNIPRYEGVVLYPTLQVYPSHPTTEAYLTHNTIPIEITDEDLEQVRSNNFVTKVIYLPEPKFRDEATAGVDTLVSTRLDPRFDPVEVADQNGTIMVVLRMGNMDHEMPNRGPAGAPAPPGVGPLGANGPAGNIQQTAFQADGEAGQFVPPVPIALQNPSMMAVPPAMIAAGSGAPGMPPYHPISGVGGTPVWGMPTTGTPIGLAGPPHIPLGGPASLKSHTIRDRSKHDIPEPVDHMLVDVKLNPGMSLPKPVEYVEYSEKHPTYKAGEKSYPAWALPPGPQPGPYPGPAPQPGPGGPSPY